ncbi:cobalamin biosynthesis protein [Salmonella enterica subsp. enterica]|uniref:Cobalamin biosynthesis protein n=1 Tax=Salmonella enterica I TaxID=59201 RepID=A0A379W7J8_SALET|nr:cobalamin biosynthesis protein [Salmonella enterica subsp. enterica]
MAQINYFGERVDKPWIGDAQRDISVDDISRTIRLMWVASTLALALFIAARCGLSGVA